MRNLKILGREVTTRIGRETTTTGLTETSLGVDDPDHTESTTSTDTITESMNLGTREIGEVTHATIISTNPQSITNTSTEDRSHPASKNTRLSAINFRGKARALSTDKKFQDQAQDLARMTPK